MKSTLALLPGALALLSACRGTQLRGGEADFLGHELGHGHAVDLATQASSSERQLATSFLGTVVGKIVGSVLGDLANAAIGSAFEDLLGIGYDVEEGIADLKAEIQRVESKVEEIQSMIHESRFLNALRQANEHSTRVLSALDTCEGWQDHDLTPSGSELVAFVVQLKAALRQTDVALNDAKTSPPAGAMPLLMLALSARTSTVSSLAEYWREVEVFRLVFAARATLAVAAAEKAHGFLAARGLSLGDGALAEVHDLARELVLGMARFGVPPQHLQDGQSRMLQVRGFGSYLGAQGYAFAKEQKGTSSTARPFYSVGALQALAGGGVDGKTFEQALKAAALPTRIVDNNSWLCLPFKSSVIFVGRSSDPLPGYSLQVFMEVVIDNLYAHGWFTVEAGLTAEFTSSDCSQLKAQYAEKLSAPHWVEDGVIKGGVSFGKWTLGFGYSDGVEWRPDHSTVVASVFTYDCQLDLAGRCAVTDEDKVRAYVLDGTVPAYGK